MAPKLYLIFFIYMVLKINFADSSCSGNKVDVFFIFDSSDTITDENFRNELIFATNFALGVKTIGKRGIQIGIQTYATQTQTIFYLDSYDDKTDMITRITSIKRLSGMSNLHIALEEVKKHGFSSSLGSRSLAHKVAIIITNGIISSWAKTISAAKSLMQDHVQLIVIGVGANINPRAFSNIASSGKDIFVVPRFNALGNLQRQIKESTCKTCNIIPKDVIFALDTSTSIDKSKFTDMKKFVSDFVLRTIVFGHNGTQVGIYTFSDLPKLELPLSIDDEKLSFISALEGLSLVHGKTNTNLVLDAAQKDGFNTAFGARPNVKHVLIVVTDGASQKPFETQMAAKRLHASNVEVFAIGVSSSVDMNELFNIASSPQNVFISPNFQALTMLISGINKLVCVKTK
ncbi:collagen alpha-4(VI) chain [Octopus bimaculoides]|uniref:VWFA domain-containing protein n=1 Tax=Octopus bimaculoides TaxID=37653 RepID=A0A0L8FJL1_OCTBM|nr:collagen alpha-4(VI) chain [Octopus bimaculoides]|eukprot:XP_014789227.1 PREDICTED: collagen alpha-5(VI) chain-like [Octopus bimaculoides]